MVVSKEFLSSTSKALFVLLKGDSKEEFRNFVEDFLSQNVTKNARLAHHKTIEDVLSLKGDHYMAVVQIDPDLRLKSKP